MNRTDSIPEYIIACCVLHNICLFKEDEFPIDEIIEENRNMNDINHNSQNSDIS
ncbi:GSCOCG00010575001-RA-CDS [Cotesia congregata]|nr:GSCOCG00010575001-RA-CDS [Cotesia congregata]